MGVAGIPTTLERTDGIRRLEAATNYVLDFQ
jgi:hypothetical protein